MQDEVRDKKWGFQSSKNIWFTSDTHFGHANILKYEKRPFKNIDEMNEFFINRWNSLVKPDDIVFHLGDIMFGGTEVFEKVVPKLNGKKYLILGNHDYKNFKEKFRKYFEFVGPKLFISIDGQSIILNHEPLLCFGGQYSNRVWQLFGHVHINKRGCHGLDDEKVALMCTPNMYDVGVDFNDFAPVKFQTVKAKIEDQIARNMNFIQVYEYERSMQGQLEIPF